MSARAFRGAVSFLTRVPTGARAATDDEIATWVPFFPLVGALVGLTGALVYVGGLGVWNPLVAAVVAVTVEVLVTGGFHEDGLGDTADALGGASNDADARRILKDPRLGSFGVLALALGLILRVTALASLDAWAAVAALPAAHALSRGAAISTFWRGKVSTGDGLGASYARSISTRGLVTAIVAGLLIAALGLGAWVLPAGFACAAVTWWIGRTARSKIGGITGDVLGAIQQCSLLAVLLLTAALNSQRWAKLPWWL